MADVNTLEEKLAEVLGLAQAAQGATEKVESLVDSDEIAEQLRTMREEAAETEQRCIELADQREGKKTAILEKARETKSEAEEMMKTYLGEDADALDGFEFMVMAEAGEVGHWEVLARLNQSAGRGSRRRGSRALVCLHRREHPDRRSAPKQIGGLLRTRHVSGSTRVGNPSDPALEGGTLGTSTIEKVGSALGNAWREATEPAKESSPKRFRGALSGMRGVIVGVGLGVLAAKKGEPLVKSAMSKYVASQATKSTDQATDRVDVPSTDQPASGSPVGQ